MLNIDLLFDLNDLNNWKDTLNIKIKLPAGGGKSLILSLNHLFNWLVWTADSFRNEASDWMGNWIIDSLDSFINAGSFINETSLCLNWDAQQLSCDW